MEPGRGGWRGGGGGGGEGGGEGEVTCGWLAEQLRTFGGRSPGGEGPVERRATGLARLDDEDDEDA